MFERCGCVRRGNRFGEGQELDRISMITVINAIPALPEGACHADGTLVNE